MHQVEGYLVNCDDEECHNNDCDDDCDNKNCSKNCIKEHRLFFDRIKTESKWDDGSFLGRTLVANETTIFSWEDVSGQITQGGSHFVNLFGDICILPHHKLSYPVMGEYNGRPINIRMIIDPCLPNNPFKIALGHDPKTRITTVEGDRVTIFGSTITWINKHKC